MSEALGTIGSRIMAAVEQAQAAGISIEKRSFGVEYWRGEGWRALCSLLPAVCPLGAFLLVEQPHPYREHHGQLVAVIADLLDRPEEWVFGFTRGFDGMPEEPSVCAVAEARPEFHREGYRTGQAIARELFGR